MVKKGRYIPAPIMYSNIPMVYVVTLRTKSHKRS